MYEYTVGERNHYTTDAICPMYNTYLCGGLGNLFIVETGRSVLKHSLRIDVFILLISSSVDIFNEYKCRSHTG